MTMLTIGQLAGLADVSIRTVRHYHRVGLLAEPARDASGYRRYGSEDVVRLLRIRALTEIGIPLKQIGELLDAPSRSVEETLAKLDVAFAEQIQRIEKRRALIARLRGTDPRLPTGLQSIAERLRQAGVSEAGIASERDAALLAEIIRQRGGEVWTIADFYAAFQQEEPAQRLIQLWLRFDALRDGAAADPQLVNDFIALFIDHVPVLAAQAEPTQGDVDSLSVKLLEDYIASLPAPQRHVVEAVGEHFAARNRDPELTS